MEWKCLRRIALSDCGVDEQAIIAKFLQFDVCLCEIILDGADLSQPLPSLKQVAVREFSSFGLSNPVKASVAFFKSLFAAMHEYSLTIKALDLSGLPLTHDDFTAFLTALVGETIRDLCSLAFDNNRLQSTGTVCFL
jgi:hypothetical protein